MLDRRLIRDNPARVRLALRRRSLTDGVVDEILDLDAHHRAAITELDTAKSDRNRLSAEFARAKDAGPEAQAALRAQSAAVGDAIKSLELKVSAFDEQLNDRLSGLPNLLADDVPDGSDESANVEVRRFLEPTRFTFEPKPHWEIGERLRILDFDRGVAIAGSRFTVLAGDGARLNRALAQFFLDRNTAAGFTELSPPVLVNRESVQATGHLSKFSDAMFTIEGGELFLSPTSEVQLVNMHRNEIIDGDSLPIRYTAYTPCFRLEAGAAGKDTRGLIRQHQFEKVEMVGLCTAEQSPGIHEKIVAQAESLLQALELPYRLMLLCAGDTGFASQKTFDLEVWLPGQNTYREISSCSNCGDFQARRAGIRYRSAPKARPEFIHTLNGSGLALGRTLVAILENYQQADGSVRVPAVLRPFMGGAEVIGPRV